MKYWTATLLVGGLLLMGGCAVQGPDYAPPALQLPQAWHTETDASGQPVTARWWTAFGDDRLNELVEAALRNNRDLRLAAARVREYAARVNLARTGVYPQVGYGAGASRGQASRNSLGGAPDGISRVGSDYQASLMVGWELDLWGRIARAGEAAQAQWLAQAYNRQALVLSLVSGVVSAYVELLSLDRQLQISRDTLERRAESLALFEEQFQGGVVSSLEVAQARAEYQSTAVLIPEIERQIRVAEFDLAVLLGEYPGPIARGQGVEQLQVPPIPAHLPSQVLLQRPDLRQAEQQLIAANALIGVARANYFPNISLTGLLGLASAELGSLLDGGSGLWNAGAALAGPLFTGGRLDAELEISQAQREQALHNYLLNIQRAFAEVDKALVSYHKLKQSLAASERQVAALREYSHFARMRYDEGYVSYIEVLDAERRLFEAELDYTRRQNASLIALIGVYKAMGGDWVNIPSSTE